MCTGFVPDAYSCYMNTVGSSTVVCLAGSTVSQSSMLLLNVSRDFVMGNQEIHTHSSITWH